MIVQIQGVRGSIPTAGSDTAFFGGNTSCITVKEGDWFLVLDGGSGMHSVKLPGKETKRVDILLTHLHLDHIQGLGFFKPLFDPSMEVHIWAPASATHSLHSRLSRYLSPPLFPVLIRDLPCQLQLHEIAAGSFQIGPFLVTSRYIIHPGPTLGYRIQCGDKTVSYLPDHEPALGPEGIVANKKWISGIDLIENADLLIHDAQYTPEEYQSRIGWGHSTMEDAIRIAILGGVSKCLLFHHDPTHNDQWLQDKEAALQQQFGNALAFQMAVEGMSFDL